MHHSPRLVALGTLIACLLAPALALAAPTKLQLEGVLHTAGGGPVADGTYPIAFHLFAEAQGGDALFEELSLAVPVTGGRFVFALGAAKVLLDDGLFIGGKARFVSLQIAADPELPRVELTPVPYANASSSAGVAFALDCSGCVGAAQLGDAVVGAQHLADGAVTGPKIGSGAVAPAHVNFTYAASDGKGGDALQSKNALALDCTGCVGPGHLADGAVGTSQIADGAVSALKLAPGAVTATHIDPGAPAALGLVASKDLAPVATSGSYTALTDLPDMSPYAQLGATNTFAKVQTLSGGGVLGADMDFAAHMALGFRFQLAAKDPYPCGVNTQGLVYYNTTTKQILLCDGAAYQNLAFVSPPGTQGNPALNCADLLAKKAGTASGVYWIQPTGVAQAFQAHCDMTGDGGGWTLALKMDGTKATFAYDAALWTNSGTLAADKPDFDTAEAKLASFSSVPFTAVRVGIMVGTTQHWLTVPLAGTSLTALFSGSAKTTSLGRNAWKSLVSNASAQPACNIEGTNGACGARTLRIGLLTNQENDCQSCDSYIGLGHSGQAGCSSMTGGYAGCMASCSADNGDQSQLGWGYLYVR